MMDPQQELFSAIRVGLEALFPGQVYDSILPPEGVAYPFIYIGDSTNTDTDRFKAGEWYGTVSQSISVWHNNARKRGELSDMLLRIKRFCCHLTDTDSFSFRYRSMQQRILPDTTTSEPLMHGVLDIDFTFMRRKDT